MEKLAQKFKDELKKYAVSEVVLQTIMKAVRETGRATHINGTKVYISGSPDHQKYGVVSAKGCKAYFDTLEEAAIEGAKCAEDIDYRPGSRRTMQEVLDKYDRDFYS